MKDFKKLFDILKKPYMRILPGNVAFSFMVALIPILSIMVFLLNILNISAPFISVKLSNFIPEAVLDILKVSLSGNGFNNIILLIIGFWTASSGMHALIIASNVIYNYEDTTYLQKRVKALLLTFLILIIIIINLGVLVFGDMVVNFLIRVFSLPNIILAIFSLLKWPIAIILIYYIVKIIYTASPDYHIKSKSVSFGAVFTTTFWVLSSWIYSAYVSIIDFGANYGALANIIILLIWLYIMSFVLVLGMALNVNQYGKKEK